MLTGRCPNVRRSTAEAVPASAQHTSPATTRRAVKLDMNTPPLFTDVCISLSMRTFGHVLDGRPPVVDALGRGVAAL